MLSRRRENKGTSESTFISRVELSIGKLSWELDVVLLSWTEPLDGTTSREIGELWGAMSNSLDEPALRWLWKISTKGLEKDVTSLDGIDSNLDSEENLICS